MGCIFIFSFLFFSTSIRTCSNDDHKTQKTNRYKINHAFE